MSLLWSILQYLSSLPIATIAFPSHGFFITFCLFVATFLFLLPRAIPLISAVIIWLLPLCYLAAEKPAYGEMWVHVLDVGQGLSVIVQTKEHVLLYDAGLRYQEYNSGEAVILPYLKFHGISRIDHMMISHGDNDHKGGASYVYNNMKVMRIKSSVPHKLDFAASDYCLAGDRFTWDGVEFKVLSPDLTNLHQGNNSSCVLMIESRHHGVLLTGDIESAAEKSLLAKPYNLKVDLLIAPHHGSKTSSTEAFVARTMPRYVVYPIGYRNRYHFPHESVVRRYDAINSYGIRTTESGSLLFKLHNNETIRYSAYRAKNCHYWYSCFIMA